ncbi:MAG TPA: universal stress protein [Burkholderiales bacterium]|nr:universal stress protein [Burkholderiales bacterium]
MFKHILIPTDGSRTSAKAITAGVQLAKEMGAQVTGLYAQEHTPTHMYGEGYLADKQMAEEFERRAAEYADRCLREIADATAAAKVPFEAVIAKAHAPHQAIIDAVEKHGCDAVFMASHGLKGFTGMVLGSVTHKVLVNSKVPMLVFR